MQDRRIGVRAEKSYFLVYYYLLAGIAILIAVFLFTRPASAQTEPSDPVSSAPVSVELPASPPVSVEQAPQAEPAQQQSENINNTISEDVIADQTVTAQDLGSKDSGILPDSPFYAFKRLGRGLREMVTFNSVEKAELRLDHANQELVDANRLLETKPDDAKSINAVAEAVGRFENKVEKIAQNFYKAEDQTEDQKKEENEKANLFLDKVLDSQIKQQKMLEKIGERIVDRAPSKAAEAVIDAVQEARDGSAEAVGEILSNAQTNENDFVERIDRVLEKQGGSEFKNLRNLEVLKRVGDKVPEQAKEAIEKAQENALKRFTKDMNEIPEQGRAERFEDYARNMGGDETRHMEIFDRLKNLGDLPDGITQKIESAKDIAAQRFQGRLEYFEEGDFGDDFKKRASDRAFQRFDEQDNFDVEKMRVMQEMQERVKFEHQKLQKKMEEEHEKGIQKFKEQFTDEKSQVQAAKFRELSQKMAENPDPTTFKLIQELENRVKADPQKREFVEKMERAAKQEFAKRAQKEGDEFFEKIASTNPRDIEVFKKLQKDFMEMPDDFFGPPPLEGMALPGMGDAGFGLPSFGEGSAEFMPKPTVGFEYFFDKAIDKQSDFMYKSLEDIKRPEDFDHFQKKFEGLSAETLKEMKSNGRNFAGLMKEKRDFVAEVELENKEREFNREIKEERRTFEMEYMEKFKQTQSEEERKVLELDKNKKEQEFVDKEMDGGQNMFEKRLEFDPFCDETCKEREKRLFEEKDAYFKEFPKEMIPEVKFETQKESVPAVENYHPEEYLKKYEGYMPPQEEKFMPELEHQDFAQPIYNEFNYQAQPQMPEYQDSFKEPENVEFKQMENPVYPVPGEFMPAPQEPMPSKEPMQMDSPMPELKVQSFKLLSFVYNLFVM